MIGRWLLAGMLLWSAHAAAQAPSVSLAASDPPLGERLGSYQALYLRFFYKSDRPIQIEAQGLHQNQRLPAMSGGIAASPAGEGDAMTWIAFKASPVGFSLNDRTRPWVSIRTKPKSDARRASTGTTAMVISAFVSRWR